MSITKREFGNIQGKKVYEYIIEKGDIEAHILNYGGIIRSLYVYGTDVVLGRDSIQEYLNNDGYYGALIGRNSNRIENSVFTLNNVEYVLNANQKNHNLHGGLFGFDKKIWAVKEKGDSTIVLSITSPDGEEGFPGKVKVSVTYTVTDDNALSITYEGKSDKDTILNMTNHAYFNLNGHNSGSAENHMLKMDCSFYTPNNQDCMPTGEILSVTDTPFDFRTLKPLKEGFCEDFVQAKMFGGIDHNFVIQGTGFRKAALFIGDVSGIKMETYTDCPGIQIYTGNGIDTNRVCKEGAVYPIHGGICFETQKFPNATNHSHFPTVFLRKGEKYSTKTSYKFSK